MRVFVQGDLLAFTRLLWKSNVIKITHPDGRYGLFHYDKVDCVTNHYIAAITLYHGGIERWSFTFNRNEMILINDTVYIVHNGINNTFYAVETFNE